MGDHVPPPPKPPVYRTYAERKAAEEKIRNAANRQTHNDYKLPPVPAPGRTKQKQPMGRSAFDEPLPPTRDMEPVKLPLAKKQENNQFADIISIKRKE